MEKFLSTLALWLLIIGGLNWGLVGLFNWNLVDSLFGESGFLTYFIYILVGVSAVWMILDSFNTRKRFEHKKPQ